ncbi:hypothetical protein ACH5RR_003295 [Cinchona calisaya]|uniref:Uncharacterized protein ycf68 n=1 Tax=Cinchona calisaya TaxID=153742 RepID=A0ABD3AUI3_9GENT
MGAGHARSHYLNRKGRDAEGRTSDWSEVVTRPSERLARRAISLLVERVPDNYVVVPGLRGLSTTWIVQCAYRCLTLRCGSSKGGPPRLLSSRGSIDLLSVYGQLSLEHRFRFGLNGKNGAPNNASSQTKNYEIAPFILGDREIGSSRKKNSWGSLKAFFFLLIGDILQRLARVRKKGEQAHLESTVQWRVVRFLVQVQDGPTVLGKRIEKASDYFMHAPLDSGDIAQLIVLGVSASHRVPSSEIPGEEDQVGPCEQLDALYSFNPLSEM